MKERKKERAEYMAGVCRICNVRECLDIRAGMMSVF